MNLFRSRVSLLVVSGVFHILAFSCFAAVSEENVNQSRQNLLKVSSQEQYAFTPKVKKAFLDFAKTQALYDLESQGKSLPKEFLDWVDSDPQIQSGVYGTRLKASDVLLVLYSIRLDLGREDFQKYRHLALAAAVVHAKQGAEVDIKPHQPVKISIGGDPRKPVNTKDPHRKLDMNDHIINFLDDNKIEEEVVVGYEEQAELKYDDRGIAIPSSKKKKKVAVKEKRQRSLYAADVIASRQLQEKFNAYMKSKGCDVNIDCGEKVIHWNSRDMVRGELNKKIDYAYKLFRTAYEAKGLLPAKRDPFPTPGEKCAYLIRNDKDRVKFETDEFIKNLKRKVPHFPLTSPWPVMTILVADSQPLREREERWLAYKNDGTFTTYGEYIGSVAQQFNMQSARRIKPHPYTYGSIQMMLKDGGVCGTMGNIGARTFISLGIPACTAGQPGHCAMISYRYDEKNKTYSCVGGQYATGGDDKTTPHANWVFGDVDGRRMMVYHQSIAWAVNYGLDSYLDSNMAYAVFRQLEEEEKKTGGLKLLESGLFINPYNFLLADAWANTADTPADQMRFWKTFRAIMGKMAKKAGCPADGLYNTTVKARMFSRLAKLPVPSGRREVAEVLGFMKEYGCEDSVAEARYLVAFKGLKSVMAATVRDFRMHIKNVGFSSSAQNYKDSEDMSRKIQAVAGQISNKSERKKWAQMLWRLVKGREKYIERRNVRTESSLRYIARLAGEKLPSETEMMESIQTRILMELRKSVSRDRDMSVCKKLSDRIYNIGRASQDVDQKRRWLDALSETIKGREMFVPRSARPNSKPQRDPCASTIEKMIQELKASA